MSNEEDTQIVPLADLAPSASVEAHFVVLSGSGIGRIHRLADRPMVLGRSLAADVVIEDIGVSREHARVERDPEGRTWLSDLGSTNGTWVEGKRLGVEPQMLQNGAHVRIGPSTILKYGDRDELENKVLNSLYQSATRDALTGVYNRRYFNERLKGELSYHRRHDVPLSLILLDIDHFKQLNDTYGHPFGDAVLKQLALILSQGVRAEDVIVRYGGEEFAIICRRTEHEEAIAIAERVRSMVARATFSDQRIDTRVTVSVGLVTLKGVELETPERMIEAADQNLYRAKAAGRNCVRS